MLLEGEKRRKKKVSGLKSFKLLLALFFIASCAGGQLSPTIYKTYGHKNVKICKVALFPFYNESSVPTAGFLLYRIFLAELAKSNLFQLVGEGDVRDFLIQRRLFPNAEITPSILSSLRENLKIDGIITGCVISLKTKGKEPEASFWIKLIDVKSGRILWYIYYSKKGGDYRKVMHYGFVDTITELLKKMCEEVIEEWRKSGLSGCG